MLENELFSETLKNFSNRNIQPLFNTEDSDEKIWVVEIPYFFLKKSKQLSSEIIIEPRDTLIGVDYDEEKKLINVYKSYHDTDIIFWINIDEVEKYASSFESWNEDEILRYNKIIKENWIKTKK
jgi:hypothetical protein